MNNSLAIALISDDVRGVSVSYEEQRADRYAAPTDDKKCLFKTLVEDLAVGDYVVVETDTRHGMTVCKVEEVDVEFDFDATYELKWAICKVGKDEFDKLKKWETTAIKRINRAEKRKKRDELRSSLKDDLGEEFTALPDFSKTDESTEKED